MGEARENFKLYTNALRGIPKFSAGPKELFRDWERSYNIWFESSQIETLADVNAQKLALLTALQGSATRAIDLVGPGTAKYLAAGTHAAFLTVVRGVFLPAAESNLSRMEFENYKQGIHQPISEYATTKLSLYHSAEPEQARRSYLYFRNEVIKGIYSPYIKDEILRISPNDEQSLLDAMMTAMGRARESYSLGCGSVISLDGLASTSRTLSAMSGQNQAFDAPEPMELGKVTDSRCYTCNRRGHQSKDCRVKKKSSGNGPKPNNTTGRKCHYCDKEGHFIADCRRKKRDDANDSQRKAKDDGFKKHTKGKDWKKYTKKGVRTTKDDDELSSSEDEGVNEDSDESSVDEMVTTMTQDFQKMARGQLRTTCHKH